MDQGSGSDGSDDSAGYGRKRQKTRGSQRNEDVQARQGAEERTVVKNEPINITIKPGRSTEMSTEADNAYTTLNGEMYQTIGIFQDKFQDMIEAAAISMGRT